MRGFDIQGKRLVPVVFGRIFIVRAVWVLIIGGRWKGNKNEKLFILVLPNIILCTKTWQRAIQGWRASWLGPVRGRGLAP